MRTKLFIILMIVFCSCGRKSTTETGNAGSVIEIDLLSEPGSKVKNLSEIAENVEYIPLQTVHNSLIGSFKQKIVNRDTKVYILSGMDITCFDLDGKFLFRIEESGRGPEEYTFISDFDVSSDNKTLTILTFNKLLVYSISDTGFTFRKSISIKKPDPLLISIVPEADNILLSIAPWTGTEPTLSLLINASGDPIHFKPNCYKYKVVKPLNFRARNETIAYTTGDKVCFKEEFSDTVFCVDTKENSFKPRMILNSHGTLTTPAIRGGSEDVGNHNNYITNIFETSRYVFYYFGSMQTRSRILFDKTTKTKYKLDDQNDQKSALNDDLSGGPDFNIEFRDSYCSGGKLFSFAEAIELKKYVAGEVFKNIHTMDPKKKDELKKLADSLKETDNPVLIVVTPKE
jgi:hypothetical protein